MISHELKHVVNKREVTRDAAKDRQNRLHIVGVLGVLGGLQEADTAYLSRRLANAILFIIISRSTPATTFQNLSLHEFDEIGVKVAQNGLLCF